MTATQTKPYPAQSPDARPVQAERTLRVRTSGEVAAERDGYRQALETEKMLRASDVRELRAALDEMLACHELRAQSMIYPLRYCTGGCANGEHRAHLYSVDPVDGPLSEIKLCPGNLGEVREMLEDGEPTNEGFIDTNKPK